MAVARPSIPVAPVTTQMRDVLDAPFMIISFDVSIVLDVMDMHHSNEWSSPRNMASEWYFAL
jgi:hypothetical protein